jgi:GT2 family glycosyltransferase
MKITATIVVYQPRMDWLLKSIQSFIDKDNFPKKLYLIDNSPILNKELEALASEKIEYLFNNRNLGFGRAHNLGIKKAIAEGSDFHLILNPDVFFDSDILMELTNVLTNDKSIGLISPKIVYENGEIQRLCKLLPNPKHLIFRRFLKNSPSLEKLNQELELQAFGYDRVAEIPWLSGCFLLARTSHLEKIGGFDERFFMYMEDIDLSRRSLRISRNIFYPYVTIRHFYEKGSYKSWKLTLIHLTSAIKYFTKWGWFFDDKRKIINEHTLQKLGYPSHSSKNS